MEIKHDIIEARPVTVVFTGKEAAALRAAIAYLTTGNLLDNAQDEVEEGSLVFQGLDILLDMNGKL